MKKFLSILLTAVIAANQIGLSRGYAAEESMGSKDQTTGNEVISELEKTSLPSKNTDTDEVKNYLQIGKITTKNTESKEKTDSPSKEVAKSKFKILSFLKSLLNFSYLGAKFLLKFAYHGSVLVLLAIILYESTIIVGYSDLIYKFIGNFAPIRISNDLKKALRDTMAALHSDSFSKLTAEKADTLYKALSSLYDELFKNNANAKTTTETETNTNSETNTDAETN